MDNQNFESIYQTYQNQIYRLCLGYFGGNSNLAKDACQEVFIKVWQNLGRFKGEAKISMWIYRIAVNTCINVLRKSKNKLQTISLKEEIAIVNEETPKTENQLQAMYACIAQLKPKDRTIILLVLDQKPYEDISSIMGISENNLRVIIHRIKDKLSKCVQL
jgi:RNA polymerase sigma-70 factor (ECF subfamily)